MEYEWITITLLSHVHLEILYIFKMKIIYLICIDIHSNWSECSMLFDGKIHDMVIWEASLGQGKFWIKTIECASIMHCYWIHNLLNNYFWRSCFNPCSRLESISVLSFLSGFCFYVIYCSFSLKLSRFLFVAMHQSQNFIISSNSSKKEIELINSNDCSSNV